MVDEPSNAEEQEADQEPKPSPYKTWPLTDRSYPPAAERPRTADTGPLVSPWRLLVQLDGEEQTAIGLEVHDAITVGRADPNEGFDPNLDLTPYGGHEGGVSRRHALIWQEDQRLFVKDLGSTNGTRLNEGALQPGQAYRLHDGDLIEMGHVRLLIRFIRTPA